MATMVAPFPTLILSGSHESDQSEFKLPWRMERGSRRIVISVDVRLLLFMRFIVPDLCTRGYVCNSTG